MRRMEKQKGESTEGDESRNTQGPREDKRSKAIILGMLRDTLDRYRKGVMVFELEKKRSAERSAAPTENNKDGKYVVDLIAPMQLRDRVVIDGPVVPTPPAQVAAVVAKDDQPLRRSNRIKTLQAGSVVPITGSGTSTGKRARSEEGNSRPRKKRSVRSAQVNK